MVGHMIRQMGVVALLAAILVGCGPSPVTRDNFNRIQRGMTRSDVEKILGPAHQSYESLLTWKTDHERKSITVTLDDQGRVAEMTFDGL